MTTKTYDNDPLGILETKEKSDPLGILGDVKKKETLTSSTTSVIGGEKPTVGTGITPLSTLQSVSEPNAPIESPFEFAKYRNKKVALPANIPRTVAEVSKTLSKVQNGSVDKGELAELYEKDYGKPIVEKLIDQYAPQLGKLGWDKEVFRNEEKWDELSKNIKTKNRINAAIQQEEYIRDVDVKIQDAIANLRTTKVSVTGGTGGAAVNENTIPIPVFDTNNPWEYGRVIEQLKTSDDVVDAEGNRIPGKKQELIDYLDQKAKYFTAKQGVDAEVLSLGNKVTDAIARSNIQREIGEDIAVDDFARDDKTNEEHFKIGLSYLKNVKPGQYKNVLRVIDEGKTLPDDDFREISEVGQEIYNQQVFFGAATNPELIDKETNLDYTTYTDKKAQYATVIGERLKAGGGTNRREFTESEIKRAAFDLPNKKIVQDLANEEKIFGYDAIPKSGALEAVVQGINQPIDGIKSTFELFSESPVETYSRSKKLDTGSAQKVVGEDGQVSGVLPSDRGNIFYDAMRGLGQFIPQVLLTKGVGGAAANVVAADARIALTPALKAGVSTYGGTAISTFLQSYGDSYADYLQKTGDVATARLGATVDAGSSAAFELILPDVKIADKALAGLKSGLSTDIIDLVKRGGDPAALAAKARPFVQKFVTNTINIAGQEIAEEDGTQLVDFITESIFSPQTAKDRDLGKELLETTKATAVSMAIPSLLGGAGSSVNQDFTKNAFNSASINFDDYRQALDKQLNNGGINQNDYNDAIKLLSTHRQSIQSAPKQNINGVEIDGQKQLDYAYEDTKIKVYQEKVAASSGIAKEMWESKIKQSEDIQREIVMPKEVESVVPITENAVTPEAVQDDILPQILENVPDVQKGEQIQYFIDKAAEDPAAFMDVHGKKITNQLLEKVPTEKLIENRDFLVKNFSESESTDFLTQIISQRNNKESQAAIQTEGTANVVPSTVSVITPEENKSPDVVPLVQPQTPVVDLGTRIETTEPPAAEGVTPVTLSGLTEQERQSKIERRVKETTVTDTQKQTNDLLKKVKSYNSLPNGRLGKSRPAGLQQLNNIRLEAQKLGLTFDERAGQLKTSGNRNIRTDNREVGDRAIAPNAVVLRDRSQQTQDVFNQLNESGQFPNGYRLDNKQMSAVEIDGAIQDIVDGIPSERANNYLNQLEKYIADDRFEIGNPGEIKLSPSLNDLLGVQPETQSQPMTPEALEAWLNDESTLTPEQEQTVIDNIENLIQDYEPAPTNETVVQPANAPTETTSGTTSEQNTEPVNTPTPPTKTAKTTTAKPTVKSLTDELRALLGNEALGLRDPKRDNNPKNRISFNDLGITETDTAESLIDKLIAHGGQFTDILKAIKSDSNFENIQLEIVNSTTGLENGESGLYYPVGYGEGKDYLFQLSNKDNVYYTATHELVHFLTLDSAVANEVKDSQSYKGLEDMYNYVADKKGKPVAIAGGATVENYGLTNVKEFMTELLLNPSFRAYVGDVFATNKEDIFKSSKALRDSKVNSIADIVYNFFVDLFNKLFNKNDGGVPFNDRFSVIQNASKNSVDLFLGGQDVISIQGQPEGGEGGTVLQMGDQNTRAAALAFPSTDRNAQINTFVKSALDRGVNEADLKQALINNGIGEVDAQSFIDSNKLLSEPDTIGITHEQTIQIEKELGFSEYEKSPETFEQWDTEADSRIRAGYNIEDLLSRMSQGESPDKIEQRIVSKYVATLKAKIEESPSDANLTEMKRVLQLSDIAGGREVGKSLVARKGLRPVDNSLSGYFIRGMEELEVETLTPNQKEKIQKEYEEIKKANEALQQKIDKLQEQNSKLNASENVSRQKAKTIKTKKTHSEFVKERQMITDHLREKLRKARGETTATIVPYAKELFAIAPDVAKLMKSLVEEGITKLGDIVDNIHDVLKDEINGITKKDVQDIIAGEYATPQKTKNQLTAKLYDLRAEAYLINKLESLELGQEPKSEVRKINRNRELAALRQQIKDTDLNKLAEAKKRIQNQIGVIEEQIKEGDFSTTEKKMPIKLDKEGKELQAKLIKLKQDREIRILKQRYAQRSKYEKARDKTLEVLNVPRSIMASMDFSAPLRQGIVASIAHPRTAALAGLEMFRSAFSQNNFDKWFYDLQNDPRYEIMKEAKLGIADPHSPFLTAKEEVYMNNLAEKIPIIGKLIKGSERAYVQYLNKMRVDLFNRFADRYEEQGKTYENNKELYDKMAGYVNNQTGRGGLGKYEDYAPVLNTLLFSPRLMAARINLLNPYYFYKLPPSLKAMYVKDMLKFVGLGLSILALAQYSGDDEDEDKTTVEWDARSSDFAKIRQGNTRWDIWGGFQPYIRVMAQMITGERKSTTKDKIYELDGKGAFGQDRADVLKTFIRGKLSPVPSIAVNFLDGRTIVGEEVTIESQLKNNLLPLLYPSVEDAIKDQGIKGVFTVGVPSIFGVGTQTFDNSKKK